MMIESIEKAGRDRPTTSRRHRRRGKHARRAQGGYRWSAKGATAGAEMSDARGLGRRVSIRRSRTVSARTTGGRAQAEHQLGGRVQLVGDDLSRPTERLPAAIRESIANGVW